MLSCLRKFYPQLSSQLKWGNPSQGKQGRIEAETQQGEAAWLGLPSRLGLALWLAGPRRGSWWPGLSGVSAQTQVTEGWRLRGGGPFVMSAPCLPASAAPPYPASGLSSQSSEAAEAGDGFPLCQAWDGPRPGPRILHDVLTSAFPRSSEHCYVPGRGCLCAWSNKTPRVASLTSPPGGQHLI